MANDLQPLVEKLQTAEKLTFSDFSGLFDKVRLAMADGRLSIREGIDLGMEIFRIVRELMATAPPGSNFGFPTS